MQLVGSYSLIEEISCGQTMDFYNIAHNIRSMHARFQTNDFYFVLKMTLKIGACNSFRR